MGNEARDSGSSFDGEIKSSEAIRLGAPGTVHDSVPLERKQKAMATGGPTRSSPSEPHPHGEIKDNFRETIETIVFVVVLVLMLKTFLAEAFVIPTGSMATTLYGYHKDIACEKCGFEFPVNVSPYVEPGEGRGPQPILAARCPNCEFTNPVKGVNDGRGGNR